MKRILILLLAIALLLVSCKNRPHYWKGADIGWATEYESRGLKFFNRDGDERECTALMKELGLDAVRFRVWVDPSRHGNWNSKEDLLVKALLAEHTRDVLSMLKAEGIEPRWVKVGNENANGRDHFRASCVSMFIKYRDFTVAQKQTTLEQTSDVTAIILNAARKMLPEIWDGVTPIRQVCMGVSRLTHESAIQMSLFEDPRMEFYQEWDRQFDEDRARYEDAKMLAYERKK